MSSSSDPWPYEDGLAELVRLLRSLRLPSIVVGVGGGSCAGKSTVSAALSEMITGSAVLPMDHYYQALPVEDDWAGVNFDEPRAMDLELLKDHLNSLLSAARGRSLMARVTSSSRQMLGAYRGSAGPEKCARQQLRWCDDAVTLRAHGGCGRLLRCSSS